MHAKVLHATALYVIAKLTAFADVHAANNQNKAT